MISVKNLDKYYFKGKSNEIHVISDTSLELPDKGLISFLGNSGSGKTTLLSVIGGLDKASGSIQYDNFEMTKYNMEKIDEFRSLHIGYVFQNFNLLLDETIYDNLRIALEIVGIADKEEIDKRIEFTLKAVGMYKFRKKKAFALSGGQQQRVAIARALLKKSKIIIADEPTGNLDSQNSIEIMNILKKISQNTLVLLVTHDKHLANFYSDFIYELKDGQVINSYAPINNGGLDKITDNNIYLLDLKSNQEETSIGKLSIYSDSDENTKLNISLIIKNGTIYLDTDKPIKLVSDAKVNVINDHYKKLSAEEVTEYNYDTSWYCDEKEKKTFKTFLNEFKNAFIRNINVSKKIKAFHFGLVLIGILVSATVVLFNNYNAVDKSDIAYNTNYNMLINDEPRFNPTKILYNSYMDDSISGLMNPTKIYYIYNTNVTLNFNLHDEAYSTLIYCNDDKVDLLYGSYPEDFKFEVLIDKRTADSWIAESFDYLTYDKIINCPITIESDYTSEEFTICGITEGDQGYIYTDKLTFMYYTQYRNTYSKYVKLRYYKNEVDSSGNSIYKVVGGRDLSDNNSNEILLNAKNYPDYIGVIVDGDKDLGKITVGGVNYRIVGVFEYPYELSKNTYIGNDNILSKINTKMGSLPKTEYTIVKGRDIENKNEMILPHDRQGKIGDVIQGKKVVGIYAGSSYAMALSGIISFDEYIIMNEASGALFFVENEKQLSIKVKEYNCNYFNTLDAQKYLEKNYDNANSIFFISCIVLAIVGFIFIYSTMRSKMIADIYKIGVYRSLGSRKISLYKKYLIDIVALSLVTSGIGYFITSFIYFILHSTLNVYLSSIQLLFNIEYFIIGFIILIMFMIVFGMLPIYRLLKKTPKEICVKYDI